MQHTTLISQVGKHFLLGLSGKTVSSEEREALKALKPAGIIISDHNLHQNLPYKEWLSKLCDLRNQIRDAIGNNEIIFAVDHEGGRIHRMPTPITHFPCARDYAKRAREAALAIATELESLGFNLLLGPVADIDSNPKNPVIAERAFGVTPTEVTNACREFIEGIRLSETSMQYALKHFPGHGDTQTDSHLELPIVESDFEGLRERELAPFESLLHLSPPAILTAHILFPKLDSSWPATLSEVLIQNLLRKELGFEGIVITDDLDMKAISDNFNESVIAKRCLLAGCDLLLFVHKPHRAAKVAEQILSSLDAGDGVYNSQVASSQSRIAAFLKNCGFKEKLNEISEPILTKHNSLLVELGSGCQK